MVTMETPIKTAYRIYNVHIMYSSRVCDSEAVVYWMASQIQILKIYDTHTADGVLLLYRTLGGAQEHEHTEETGFATTMARFTTVI